MAFSQDAATAPTRYLLTEKLRELRGKYKSGGPFVSPFPCRKCGWKVYSADGYQCRRCDPVERINDEIEGLVFTDFISNMEAYLAYIEAADIILENEE